MPVDFHPDMKIDSRYVLLGDWVFYSGLADLTQVRSLEQLARIQWALDDHNAREERYGIFPKVFARKADALEYIDDHVMEVHSARR